MVRVSHLFPLRHGAAVCLDPRHPPVPPRLLPGARGTRSGGEISRGARTMVSPRGRSFSLPAAQEFSCDKVFMSTCLTSKPSSPSSSSTGQSPPRPAARCCSRSPGAWDRAAATGLAPCGTRSVEPPCLGIQPGPRWSDHTENPGSGRGSGVLGRAASPHPGGRYPPVAMAWAPPRDRAEHPPRGSRTRVGRAEGQGTERRLPPSGPARLPRTGAGSGGRGPGSSPGCRTATRRFSAQPRWPD